MKNAEILDELFENKRQIKEAVLQTNQLFLRCHGKNRPDHEVKVAGSSLSLLQKIVSGLFRLLAKPSQVLPQTQTILEPDGTISPDWKRKLDKEYAALLQNITREVNVADYGAIGDGLTDCTAAFKKAIGNGRVKVSIPEGVYVTKGIRLPSWTYLVGAGKGITTIKLHHRAAKGVRLITNANHWKGNTHLLVQGMSLDWNVLRLGEVTKTSTWGNHSSCLTYANVSYGWVKEVEGINPGLHCFDITSTMYNYAGDGYRARGGSRFIWLDQVTGYGFGDDGITTHHSDYIFISNSHMCDPSGRAHKSGFSNSNGIEIDDGTRNVLLVNNSTARCFGGVESKAHENSSAASNVEIVGHISVNDNRSYNFRHIGHHKRTDTESKTAYNIKATYLASIEPIFTELYKESSPRAMVVSAYKNVVVSQFIAVGDPDYDYKSNPVVSIQFQAQNVSLQNLKFRDFVTAGSDIKVFGGDNYADNVSIDNVLSFHSAPKVVASSERHDVTNIKILEKLTKF
ncbi:pectate lyase [Bacillus sp. MRMR6]|nr:pectate lyase [Bacillus sp. MRMR6]